MHDPTEDLAEYLIANGINAMLPQELDSYWLAILTEQVRSYVLPKDDGEAHLQCLLHIALLFIAYVEGKSEFSVEEEKVHQVILRYGFQLMHELWHRQGKLPYGTQCTITDIVSGKSVSDLQSAHTEYVRTRDRSQNEIN